MVFTEMLGQRLIVAGFLLGRLPYPPTPVFKGAVSPFSTITS